MTPESTRGSHHANGSDAPVSEAPGPPIPSFGGPEAREPKSPPPHLHDAPPPAPDEASTCSSSKALPVGLAVAGLLAGAAGGFAAGRATAPRRRSMLRLPFGARRRAVLGGVKLAPMFVRGTYRTGKVAGKSTAKVARAARR